MQAAKEGTGGQDDHEIQWPAVDGCWRHETESILSLVHHMFVVFVCFWFLFALPQLLGRLLIQTMLRRRL